MWFFTSWDIQVRHFHRHSDHFDLDRYNFYNPFRGNFEIGIQRGEYTVGDLVKNGNRW
jgi:hypothetical protein